MKRLCGGSSLFKGRTVQCPKLRKLRFITEGREAAKRQRGSNMCGTESCGYAI